MPSRKLEVEIVGDASSLNRALGSASKASSGAGKAFATMGKYAVLAGAAVGTAAVVGIGKSIKAASDLTEQVNKANVVFRNNGQEVVRWSQGLAQNFGLSSRAALEAAGTFGNMLVPMGFARDKAADMSEAMVQLGGDMASFNNASIEDTLLAIRSGLAGETEPLRKYGVFLSAARVQQEALAETGKKNAKQLTQSEKALASYNIILKDTKDTQGDFARSAGGSLANQIRIAQAQFENIAASVGKVFLPVVIKVLEFVNSKLIPGLSNAGKAVSDWFRGVSSAFGKAKDFKAKFNVAITGGKELAEKFVDTIVSQVTSLLPQKEVPLPPIRFQSRRGGETISGGVDWDAVAADMIAGLTVALQQAGDFAKALGQTITDAIGRVDWVAAGRKMGPGLATAVATAFATLTDPAFWVKNWDLALAIGLTVFGGAIGRFAGRLLAKMTPALVGVVTRVSPQFAAAMGRLMDDAANLAIRAFDSFGRNMLSKVTSLFPKLGRLSTFVIKVLGITAAIDAVQDFARQVGQWIQKAIDWFKRLPGQISAALGGIPAAAGAAAVAIGEAITGGIIRGLAGLVGRVGSAIAGAVHSAISWAHAHVGSTTDEYASATIGVKIPDGIAEGVEKNKGKAAAAAAKAAKEAIDKAAQAVTEAKGNLASAFGGLADSALQAFDAAVDAWVSPAQKILDKMQLQDARKQVEDAVREARQAVADARREGAQNVSAAQADLTKALAGGDPEEIARATQAVVDAQRDATKSLSDAQDQQAAAIRARREYNLGLEAQQQKDAHDKRMARQRIHLQEELEQVGTWLAKHPDKYKEAFEKVSTLLKRVGVDAKTWGSAIGIALAQGLREAKGDVADAARDLAAVIKRYLETHSPTEEGPMSDLDKWWNSFSSTLVSGLNTKPITNAGVGIARAMQTSVASGFPTTTTASIAGGGFPSGAASISGVADVTVPIYLDSSQIAEVVRREYLRFEKRNGRSAV